MNNIYIISQVLPELVEILTHFLHIEDFTYHAKLLVSPHELRWKPPLLCARAVLKDEVLPIGVINGVEYRGRLLVSLINYVAVQGSIIYRPSLLHGCVVFIEVMRQILFDRSLYFSIKNVAVFTHHFLAKSNCFNDIILDAENYQVLSIEGWEHSLR